jgi:cytochrome b561
LLVNRITERRWTVAQAAQARWIGRDREEVMNWHKWFGALFAMLLLTGCAQRVTGQTQAPHAPYSPEENGNIPEHGGGDGGGGGGGM